MAEYSVTLMLNDKVLGWAETDDSSMRFNPDMCGPGRQSADEIDIRNLAFNGATIKCLGDPSELGAVLSRAPFEFKIAEKESAKLFKTLPNCSPKNPGRYVGVPLNDALSTAITFCSV